MHWPVVLSCESLHICYKTILRLCRGLCGKSYSGRLSRSDRSPLRRVIWKDFAARQSLTPITAPERTVLTEVGWHALI
jgi:hypothetical protein